MEALSRPGYKPGFPSLPCLRGRHSEVISLAKGLTVQERGLLWAGTCLAGGTWASAQPARSWRAGAAFGCCFPLLRQQRPGPRRDREQTLLTWHHLETSEGWALAGVFTPTVPLWGRTMSSTASSHLPCLPLQGRRAWGRGAHTKTSRVWCFSPLTPLYLGESPRKAESWELAPVCVLIP